LDRGERGEERRGEGRNEPLSAAEPSRAGLKVDDDIETTPEYSMFQGSFTCRMYFCRCGIGEGR
jgi:hypothetical protein